MARISTMEPCPGRTRIPGTSVPASMAAPRARPLSSPRPPKYRSPRLRCESRAPCRRPIFVRGSFPRGSSRTRTDRQSERLIGVPPDICVRGPSIGSQ